MEPKYIVAICALGVFFILFLIFFVLLARKRKADAKLQAYLYSLYSDSNLVKADYDTSEDGGTDDNRVRAAVGSTEVQPEREEPTTEAILSKKDIEGIEEITGNYIPE